jgi:hypothetical protein
VHEDGADFGRVDAGVEQLGFADGSATGAEESFAFGPSAAGGQALMRFRIGVESFGYEVGLVDEELGVEAEDGAERAFDLRGGVIAGLQATDGSFNQRVERGDVCGVESGGAGLGLPAPVMSAPYQSHRRETT